MDNGNKISLTHKEVALFLGDELKNFNKNAAKPYNLEKEYAKTKNNHQTMVWILLAFCFAFVGIGTFIAAKAVSSSNEKISVNIDTFNDLNLKELLSMLGNSQNLYDEAVRAKENLEEELQNALVSAERKLENDNFTLKAISFYTKKSEIEEKQRKINDDFSQAVNAAHEKYDPQIKKAEDSIKKYKSQVDGFDSTMVAQAKMAEGSLDSQKQLNDIKLSRQVEKTQRQIKRLRDELSQEQIRSKEEMQQAVDQVQETYQSQIAFLVRSHNDFLEKLIARGGGDGIVKNADDKSKIRIYISETKISKIRENPEIKCIVGSNKAEFSIAEENGGDFFAVNPMVFPPIPAVDNKLENKDPSQGNSSQNAAEIQSASLSPLPADPNTISAFAGDKIEFIVPLKTEHKQGP